MRYALLALTLVLLSACANTFDGARRDAQRMGEKMHTISETITAP